MTPIDFGMIRQADYNLFAMLFPPLTDISEYEIEVIYPEYVDGGYVGSNGAITSAQNYSYAIQTGMSKYDYVLIPVSSYLPSTIYSGLRVSADPSGGLPLRCGRLSIGTAWCLWSTSNHAYDCALITMCNDYGELPIIGFRRHRSDQVNPLGIIQPINPGILLPGSLQPQVEDPDELDVQDPVEEQEES